MASGLAGGGHGPQGLGLHPGHGIAPTLNPNPPYPIPNSAPTYTHTLRGTAAALCLTLAPVLSVALTTYLHTYLHQRPSSTWTTRAPASCGEARPPHRAGTPAARLY